MNPEAVEAIRQSKAVWLDQFTRTEVIFLLCALAVQLSLLVLDYSRTRQASLKMAATWWRIGMTLLALSAAGSIGMLVVLLRELHDWTLPLLLANGTLALAILVLWTRFGVLTETEVMRVLRRLADTRRAVKQHQTQLDAIVSRRTQVLNQEIIERRKAQQELTAALERNQLELDFARELQQALLAPAPQLDFAAIEVNYQPASDVSGDTYSFTHNDAQLRIILADAMGHGISAALLTQLVLAISLGTPLETGPRQLFEQLNHLINNNRQQAYVTASWLRLHANGTLEFCGAGNAPLVIWRHNRQCMETLDGAGQALGMFADISQPHELQRIELGVGDRILLLTDGLLEWSNPGGDMFGLSGVEKALQNCAGDSLAYAIAGLQNAAWEHAEMRSCRDDVSVIGLEFTGRP